jgi:hypothetical protein
MTGIKLAERSRSNAQWYDPCDLLGLGNEVASLTVPLRIAGGELNLRVFEGRSDHGRGMGYLGSWRIPEYVSRQ